MKDHGRRVGCIDRGHETKRATFRRFIPRSANEIESRFDIGRSDGMAIVELNVFAQVKDPGQRIGRFPRFGEVAVEIHFGVAFEEAGEEKAVDALLASASFKVVRSWQDSQQLFAVTLATAL